MKIRKASPFEGAPVLHLPKRYGICTGKETLLRIAATGARPITFSLSPLPAGLTFDGNVIRGTVAEEGDYPLTISAENASGKAQTTITLCVHEDTVLLTPLMGFTSWNAFGSAVTQSMMEDAADRMISSGLADYGYSYVNIDSGWQKEYGGKWDAILPNEKFPDMEGFCARTHKLGLKCGIYSTPMLNAWGCPEEMESIPGCTRGEADPYSSCINGGIGMEHMERNNVRQWEEWGFDYLKYDWRPSDPQNADLMKQALLQSSREMAYCVTLGADRVYRNYWKKRVNSWRDGHDSMDRWEAVKLYLEPTRITAIEDWRDTVSPGHFYDLDMLEIGPMHWNGGKTRLTENEAVFAYTMRAFFLSPLQLSCHLDALSDFERDLVCNEDVIRINQDSLGDYPALVIRADSLQIFARTLENGDHAYAVFNLSDNDRHFAIGVEGHSYQELWTGRTGTVLNRISDTVEPHCALIYRVFHD